MNVYSCIFPAYLGGDFIGCNRCLGPPVPYIDAHIMLSADGHNILEVGMECHAADTELVSPELAHLSPLFQLPDTHRRLVTTLQIHIHN